MIYLFSNLNPISKMKPMIITALACILFTACSSKQDFYEDNQNLFKTPGAKRRIGGGLVDNTEELQAYIDNHITKGTKLKGTYLTSQLTIHSYDTILLPSNTATFLLNPAVTNQAIFYLPSGTHDVYIEGGILDANWQNTAGGSQLECIKMEQGCYNITINGTTVNNAKDYGAIQIKGVDGAKCRNIRLIDIQSEQTGRTAIECRGVENLVIDKPVIRHWGQQYPNSPAIQFQSVASHNVQILKPTTEGYESNQFAIESAAANVDSIYIEKGKFNDNTNAGNNGISGYYTNGQFMSCDMKGGVGSQRSGYELFGSNNTIDHPKVSAGIIAISTGSVTGKNASNIHIISPDVTSTGSNNSALDLGSFNGLILSDVTIEGGKLDTRSATGNSSAFTFGYYGGLGIVQNVVMNDTHLYSSTSAVRIQAADGSKNLTLNQVGFMEQTQEVSDITHNVNYTINR